MRISALINPNGTPARVVEAVLSGNVVAVVSQRLRDELTAVLTGPKFWRWITVADALAFVEVLGGSADLQPEPQHAPRRMRDQTTTIFWHSPKPPERPS